MSRCWGVVAARSSPPSFPDVSYRMACRTDDAVVLTRRQVPDGVASLAWTTQ